MKRSSLQSGSMFTQEMVEILGKACESPKTRTEALGDPRSVLSRHGIELADDCELYLFERAPASSRKPPQKYPTFSAPIIARKADRVDADRGDGEPLQQLPPGWQTIFNESWGPSHGGCPFPLNPYKTKKKVSDCLIWAFWVSGKEWVQDGGYGHFEYSNVSRLCLVSYEQEIEVTECR